MLTLPTGVPSVGACPDSVSPARQRAIEQALQATYNRVAIELRPNDFGADKNGPWLTTFETNAIRVPSLRFQSGRECCAYALLGVSHFLPPLQSLTIRVALTWSAESSEKVRWTCGIQALQDAQAVSVWPDRELHIEAQDARTGDLSFASGELLVPSVSPSYPLLLTVRPSGSPDVDLLFASVVTEARI